MFNRNLVARVLVKIAKNLVAFENDEEEAAKAVELGQKIDNLMGPAKAAFAEAQKTIDELDSKKKAAEKALKDAFKEWDAQTGFSAAKKELEGELAEFKKAGGNLEKIAATCKVAGKKSIQPSYKEWMSVIVSTLNDAELKKYFETTLQAFKKDMLEVKTGISVLDVCLKEWDNEAKELADERGVALPKASRRLTASGQIITAGLLDWFKKIGMSVATLIKDVFGPVIRCFKGLAGKAKANAEKAKAFNGKIGKLAAKAESL
ncbi:MAG: hypothetical protein J5654_11280 [Victivallales bacterium]|nr:hypothetical protein [Victivallales bacterium]